MISHTYISRAQRQRRGGQEKDKENDKDATRRPMDGSMDLLAKVFNENL